MLITNCIRENVKFWRRPALDNPRNRRDSVPAHPPAQRIGLLDLEPVREPEPALHEGPDHAAHGARAQAELLADLRVRHVARCHHLDEPRVARGYLGPGEPHRGRLPVVAQGVPLVAREHQERLGERLLGDLVASDSVYGPGGVLYLLGGQRVAQPRVERERHVERRVRAVEHVGGVLVREHRGVAPAAQVHPVHLRELLHAAHGGPEERRVPGGVPRRLPRLRLRHRPRELLCPRGIPVYDVYVSEAHARPRPDARHRAADHPRTGCAVGGSWHPHEVRVGLHRPVHARAESLEGGVVGVVQGAGHVAQVPPGPSVGEDWVLQEVVDVVTASRCHDSAGLRQAPGVPHGAERVEQRRLPGLLVPAELRQAREARVHVDIQDYAVRAEHVGFRPAVLRIRRAVAVPCRLERVAGRVDLVSHGEQPDCPLGRVVRPQARLELPVEVERTVLVAPGSAHAHVPEARLEDGGEPLAAHGLHSTELVLTVYREHAHLPSDATFPSEQLTTKGRLKVAAFDVISVICEPSPSCLDACHCTRMYRSPLRSDAALGTDGSDDGLS